MNRIDLTGLVRQGLTALENENTLLALTCFEKVASHWETAVVLSCLGYCLARERSDLDKALALCKNALSQEPANPLHYLNMGRIYLLAQQKHLAVFAFNRGLEFGRHPVIMKEIDKLGRRRPPIFPFLGRKHALNRFLGYLRDKMSWAI